MLSAKTQATSVRGRCWTNMHHSQTSPTFRLFTNMASLQRAAAITWRQAARPSLTRCTPALSRFESQAAKAKQSNTASPSGSVEESGLIKQEGEVEGQRQHNPDWGVAADYRTSQASLVPLTGDCGLINAAATSLQFLFVSKMAVSLAWTLQQLCSRAHRLIFKHGLCGETLPRPFKLVHQTLTLHGD